MSQRLSAREAAVLVGYRPDPSLRARRDRAMRSFWEWARRKRIPRIVGGPHVLFLRRDIELQLQRVKPREPRPLSVVRAGLKDMEQIAIQHARGR